MGAFMSCGGILFSSKQLQVLTFYTAIFTGFPIKWGGERRLIGARFLYRHPLKDSKFEE